MILERKRLRDCWGRMHPMEEITTTKEEYFKSSKKQ